MKKLVAMALVSLSALWMADMASAQVRLPAYNGGAPVQRAPKIVPPLPRVIQPSVALKRAMGQVPGAQALSVRPRGNLYIVKLKKGGNIIQFNVNSATGAMTRLP